MLTESYLFVSHFLVDRGRQEFNCSHTTTRIVIGKMSDQKKPRVRPGLYHGDANRGGRLDGATRASSSATPNDPRISEKQGGEAIRKWLSRDNSRPTRRLPPSTSIYSWRGYNNWTKKVRQTWKADEPVDS